MSRKIFFNLDKLKANDPTEISNVANYYKDKKLTNKQVGLIAYHAKPALDAIQAIVKEASKSHEHAFKSNVHATDSAYAFASKSQEKLTSTKDKQDAYHHSANLHRDSLASNERINANNNSLYRDIASGVGKIAALAVALTAVVAYAQKK